MYRERKNDRASSVVYGASRKEDNRRLRRPKQKPNANRLCEQSSRYQQSEETEPVTEPMTTTRTIRNFRFAATERCGARAEVDHGTKENGAKLTIHLTRQPRKSKTDNTAMKTTTTRHKARKPSRHRPRNRRRAGVDHHLRPEHQSDRHPCGGAITGRPVGNRTRNSPTKRRPTS